VLRRRRDEEREKEMFETSFCSVEMARSEIMREKFYSGML
jgi:hypothetical protein